MINVAAGVFAKISRDVPFLTMMLPGAVTLDGAPAFDLPEATRP
jgi:hypothetical protein